MTDSVRKTLACGCQVDAARDFLGRVVGTIAIREEACPCAEHVPGYVLVMPGRENARLN